MWVWIVFLAVGPGEYVRKATKLMETQLRSFLCAMQIGSSTKSGSDMLRTL